MSRHSTFGLLLFGGIIVLTVSRHSRFLRGINFKKTQKVPGREIGSRGDFVVSGSCTGSLRGHWRSIVSLEDGELKDESCEVEVINDCGETLIFCWIDHSGKLLHYVPVSDGSIKDGSVSNKHLEYANTHHAFVCIRQTKEMAGFISDIVDKDFVFVYRPTLKGFRHSITLKRSSTGICAQISCNEIIRAAVIDTSKKEYNELNICGFTCYCEPNLFDSVPTFRDVLTRDLEALSCLLPSTACALLQNDTPLWINTNITFGTEDKPIVGKICTFHPLGGEDWLERMGMRIDKVGGIEMYSAEDYLHSREQWGTGGLLLHEYCHAYHNKHCDDGYDCSVIRDAFTLAMDRKLYDCVPVHGKQGANGPTKAYACFNCMEFFAELSVAFHWVADETTEFNKWFPHNCAQLIKHDPDTYATLCTMWRCEERLSALRLDNRNSDSSPPTAVTGATLADNAAAAVSSSVSSTPDSSRSATGIEMDIEEEEGGEDINTASTPSATEEISSGGQQPPVAIATQADRHSSASTQATPRITAATTTIATTIAAKSP